MYGHGWCKFILIQMHKLSCLVFGMVVASSPGFAAAVRAYGIRTFDLALIRGNFQRVDSRNTCVDFLALFLKPVINLNFLLLVISRPLHFLFALIEEELAKPTNNFRLLLLDGFVKLCFVVRRGAPQSSFKFVRELHHEWVSLHDASKRSFCRSELELSNGDLFAHGSARCIILLDDLDRLEIAVRTN